MPVRFIYFDLGKVLVRFDVAHMLRQIADVAGCEVASVERVLFDARLQADYELGKITRHAFYEAFCRETRCRPDFDRLAHAASDIFEINPSIVPVVAGLRQAGYRLGVLSNTCDIHWEHCLRKFGFLAELFDVHALSYRLGAMKPDRAIFTAAAELAGCRPEEIFFTDDVAANVAGARAAGLDAIQYTGTPELIDALRHRGVRFEC